MTTLSIILKKGKHLKYIEWQGRFITEKTSFNTTIAAQLQFKLKKDMLKRDGWNTYIQRKAPVSSNIEHTRAKKYSKVLGRYVENGTVGVE